LAIVYPERAELLNYLDLHQHKYSADILIFLPALAELLGQRRNFMAGKITSSADFVLNDIIS